jgi:hypothetical protein
MRILLAFLFTLAAAHTCLALEASTYKGRLGKLPIIVELTEAGPDGAFVGRYAYVAKGVDIPLHGVRSGNKMTLEEEQPCTAVLCKKSDGETVEHAPIGADWVLTADADAARLSGTWHDRESGKSLEVMLARVAKRDLGNASNTDFDALDPIRVFDIGLPGVLTADDLPYDFLKMHSPLKKGEVTLVGEAKYRMDEDPRVGLSYPTIVSLGGADVAPVNAYLFQQRLKWEYFGFDCLRKAYFGFGWSENIGGQTNGYYDDPVASIAYLTPRLLGLSEDGSYFCGGAHPEYFSHYLLGDVRTGDALAPESLLKGWLAKNDDGAVVDPATVDDPSDLRFEPSEDLIRFVISKREKFDAETETECGIDDLVRSNLGVNITGDSLVFTLTTLPYAIRVCLNGLLVVPLKDARPLLTDAGAAYFEALDR